MDTNLFASVGFSMCSLFFAIFMLFMYFNKKRLNNTENNVFVLLLGLIFVLIFLEFIYVACLYNNYSSIISKVFCYAWLNGIIVWMLSFVYYVSVLRTKKDEVSVKKTKRKKLRIILIVIGVISLIAANILPISFYDYSNHVYSFAGDATYVGFGIAGITIISIVYILIIRKDTLDSAGKKTVILTVAFITGLTILQFINDKLDLNYQNFEFTLLLMTLFFTTQNQDSILLSEHEEAKEEAGNANKAQTEFLTSMSHEIRTPMNTIIGFSDVLIREGATNEEAVRRDVKNINSAANTLLDLINNILDLSRVDSQKEQIVEKEYDVDQVIIELDEAIKKKISNTNIKYNIEVDPNLPKRLSGDYVKINKVVGNLVSNIISYSKEATIDIKIDSKRNDNDEQLISFSIRSNGSVISEEEYNKYYLNENTSNNVNTNVLDLNVAKVYAKMLGSEVIITNVDRFNIGYDFAVIEQVINPAPIGDVKALLEKKDETGELNVAGKKAMVVDDNTINIKLIERFLKEFGMEVESVTSGNECIEKVMSNDYDIIFLDHMMPVKDGLQTLDELKDKKSNLPPVIALTANAYSGVRDFYINAGFQDYVAKPVNRGDLANVLQQYIK